MAQSAINSVKQEHPLNPCQPDHDLLRDIRTKIRRLPISINWLWIPGHQDDRTRFKNLHPTKQDNILANDIAKAYCEHLVQTQPPTPNLRFPDEGWTVYLGEHKQTRLDKQKIYQYLTQPTAMEYWKHKMHYTETPTHTTQWDDLGTTLSSPTPPIQRHTIKHATGHFGCGTKLHLWGHQDHDDCPFCQLQENPKHIL